LKHLEPKKIVLIGASTGGPGQIQKIVSSLPELQDITIVIAQHMMHGFIDSFARGLRNKHHFSISLIQNNQSFEKNKIYVCEGEVKLIDDYFSKKSASTNSFNPSINTLFHSFIPLCKNREILSLILTGIGDDGVMACRELSINGARCITESEESAIVDGMPSRARLLVPNIEVYKIDEIVKTVREFCE